jgi:hypothetical protein
MKRGYQGETRYGREDFASFGRHLGNVFRDHFSGDRFPLQRDNVIFNKLGANDRTEAAIVAARLKLID